MTTDERALLAAAAETPGDDLLWLVYDDWLEERGHPGAAFVRYLHRLSVGPLNAGDLAAHEEIYSGLRAALPTGWADGFADVWATRPLVAWVESVFEIPAKGVTLPIIVIASGTLRTGDRVAVPRVDGGAMVVPVMCLERFSRTETVVRTGSEQALWGMAVSRRWMTAGDILRGGRITPARLEDSETTP